MTSGNSGNDDVAVIVIIPSELHIDTAEIWLVYITPGSHTKCGFWASPKTENKKWKRSICTLDQTAIDKSYVVFIKVLLYKYRSTIYKRSKQKVHTT